jgi:hypothetical protein
LENARERSSGPADHPIARQMPVRVPGSCRLRPLRARLSRAGVCSLLAATVFAMPSAASAQVAPADPVAKQASVAEGVATALATEVVKLGIRSAVAQWAPDLTKYVDPVGHGLAEIQAKLEEINRKLEQLIAHQEALEQHLNCVTQRVALHRVLSESRTWFAALREARDTTELSERDVALQRLESHYLTMVADQEHLHIALEGPDGLIVACARHIQSGMDPYLSSALGDDVDNFYSIYHTAAAELLIVRANMIALHPGRFAKNAAEKAAEQVQGWWGLEQARIKPTFPASMSYDTKTRWLWWSTTIPWWDNNVKGHLEHAGFRITGRSTTPTCSGVEAYVKQSRRSGRDALNYVRRLHVLDIPSGDTILCFDDHDRIHDFNLVTYHYRYAGDYRSEEPSVAARPNDGWLTVSLYSY